MMTSANTISTTQYIQDEDGQIVEASIIQLVEDEDGIPNLSGTSSLDANKAMVLNEATGEVEVIDLADPTVSHEVEVVTVDSDRLFGSRRFGGRLKNAPALLRNSRRVNNQGFHVQEIPQLQQVIMAPATLPPASASFSKSGRQGMNNTPVVNTSHPHTSRLSHNSINNFSNINILQSSAITTSTDGRDQQFVILSDGGVPLANTEYSIVQDEDLQERLRELLMQQQDVKPNIMEITGSDQQTIYICDNGSQEDGLEVAEIMEEIDGNFIQPGNGNIIYHLDESGNIVSVSGMGTADSTGTVVLEHSVPTPTTKKRGRKSANVLDTSKNNQKKRATTELKCLEPDCQAVCYNVGELRKHLTSVHDNHFDEETVIFGSEDAFKLWRESYERERMVSFIYRGGTKKIAKDQAVTYLICHRSGHYKPTMGDVSKRKRKMKPQGSCKMGGYCTAGIKLLKNLESGEVKMDICHTHYGHPLDNQAIPHLRVNPMLRNVILQKFKDGMSFNEVLEFIHHNPDGLEGLRLVDRRAVRNIFDQWKNPRRRSKVPSKSDPLGDLEDAEPMEIGSDSYSAILPDGMEPENNGSSSDQHDSENSAEDKPPKMSSMDLLNEILEPGDPSEPPAKEKVKSKEGKSAGSPSKDKASDAEGEEEKEDEVEHTADGDAETFDITIVKEEIADSTGDKTASKFSKNNYTLRPKKRESLAHLLKPKRHRKSSASTAGEEKERAVIVPGNPDTSGESEEQDKEISPSPSSPTEAVDNKRKRKKKMNVDHIKKESYESVIEIIDMVVKNPNEIKSPVASPAKKRKSMRESEKMDSDEDHDPKGLNNIEQCIEKLYRHGESGPTVLMYKKEGKIAPVYGDITKGFRESDRCIVLQTPVQRQLMQMFPHTIGVEVIEGKATDMKLVFVMVIDDYREAIPVAWMVSDVIEQRVITNFFRCLRNECGEIAAHFLMAPKNADFYRLWCMTFTTKPKYIQNEYDARKDLRVTVQQNFTSEDTKKQVWSFVESLLTEKIMSKFNRELAKVEPFFKNLNSPNSGIFLKSFQKNWTSTPEEWALAYRINTSVNTIFAADSFAKLKKFISFKGTKRLRYSVDHILKIGYDKCFLRSKRMFKGDQKQSQHLEEIRRRHFMTTEWKIDYLRVCEDNFNWYVRLPENEERLLVTDVRSPCVCKTVCSECGICMHMYLCSCPDFKMQKMMCEHIHFVHTMRNENIEMDTDSTEIKIISTTSELPPSSSFTVYEPEIKISADDPDSESQDPTIISITGDLSSVSNAYQETETELEIEEDNPDNVHTEELPILATAEDKTSDSASGDEIPILTPEGETTDKLPSESDIDSSVLKHPANELPVLSICNEEDEVECKIAGSMEIEESEAENSGTIVESSTVDENKKMSSSKSESESSRPKRNISPAKDKDKILSPVKSEPVARKTLRKKPDAVPTIERATASKPSTRKSVTKKPEVVVRTPVRSLRSKDTKTPVPATPTTRPQRFARKVQK